MSDYKTEKQEQAEEMVRAAARDDFEALDGEDNPGIDRAVETRVDGEAPDLRVLECAIAELGDDEAAEVYDAEWSRLADDRADALELMEGEL